MSARKRGSTVLALFMAGCGSPGAPGQPPAGALPPAPAANACGPALQVGRDWFHLGDLISGSSCPVYLEQDECVLGIYDDCSVRVGGRQWLGRISADASVLMTGERTNTPGSIVCAGRVEGEADRDHLDFTCSSGSSSPVPRLVLARRVDPAPSFATARRRVEVAPIRGASFANFDEYMFDVARVQVGSQRQLWFTVEDRGLATSGLHILNESDQSILAFVQMDGVNLVASSGDTVIALAATALKFFDKTTRAQTAAQELSGEVAPTALGVSEPSSRVFAAFNPGSPERQALLAVFDLQNASLIRTQNELRLNLVPTIATVPVQTDGTIAFLFGIKPSPGGASLIAVDANLAATRSFDLPFTVESARYLPERGVIGAVGGNRYIELDPADLTLTIRRAIGVPYTENGLDFSYDPESERVYFLGRTFLTEDPMRSYHLRPSLVASIDLVRGRTDGRVEQVDALTRRVLHLSGTNAVIVPMQRIGEVQWFDL